jgi:hypothetical protein
MKKTIKKNNPPVVPVAANPVAPKTPAPTKAAAPAAPNAVTATPAATSAVPVATPAPVKSAVAVKGPVSAAAPVTIEAQIDVGFGNNLFVRGQGGGLSWERGIPLENVDPKTWRLTVPAKDTLQFKLLLNDTVWCKGEDLVASPGKKVQISPSF